jgi:hypothetical protein
MDRTQVLSNVLAVLRTHCLAELGRLGRHKQSSGLFVSGLCCRTHGLAELGRFGRHKQS